MTIDEIKELIQVFNESGVAELEVQRGENRVKLRRASYVNQEVVVAQPAMAPAVSQAPAHIPAPAAALPATVAAHPAPAKPSAADEGNELVKSPIVGTYYDAPSPGAPTFVRVGDQVEPGQVLCIIESMKLMNEIEAEFGGTITAKLVENGRPVEYGEALFAIRPR
jgi:acetyl-CoA carboxylase biotin carboxyl carrier protein